MKQKTLLVINFCVVTNCSLIISVTKKCTLFKGQVHIGILNETSFPGFYPTRPYGVIERESLVGSGHMAPEQN